MWTLREKKTPSRLSLVLITVNLQRRSRRKYHSGIFLFTSCRSSSVTFNLYKYLPFENIAFPHLCFNKSPPLHILHSSFCQLLPDYSLTQRAGELSFPNPSPTFPGFFPSWGPTSVLRISAWQTRSLGGQGRHDTLLIVVTMSGKTTRICPAEVSTCY